MKGGTPTTIDLVLLVDCGLVWIALGRPKLGTWPAAFTAAPATMCETGGRTHIKETLRRGAVLVLRESLQLSKEQLSLWQSETMCSFSANRCEPSSISNQGENYYERFSSTHCRSIFFGHGRVCANQPCVARGHRDQGKNRYFDSGKAGCKFQVHGHRER